METPTRWVEETIKITSKIPKPYYAFNLYVALEIVAKVHTVYLRR